MSAPSRAQNSRERDGLVPFLLFCAKCLNIINIVIIIIDKSCRYCHAGEQEWGEPERNGR